VARFNDWLESDRTKEGLLNLIKGSEEGSEE